MNGFHISGMVLKKSRIFNTLNVVYFVMTISNFIIILLEKKLNIVKILNSKYFWIHFLPIYILNLHLLFES